MGLGRARLDEWRHGDGGLAVGKHRRPGQQRRAGDDVGAVDASDLAASGKSASYPISMPTRPAGMSKVGKPRLPGVAQARSSPARWSLR